MTKFTKYTALLPMMLAALLTFAACTGDTTSADTDGDETETYALNIISGSARVKYTGGSVSIIVVAAADWRAEVTAPDDNSWIALDRTEGEAGKTTVLITVAEHTLPDERTAVVTFTCGDEPHRYTVIQEGKPEITIIDDGFERHIPFTGGDITVNFAANTEYTVTTPDWIHNSDRVPDWIYSPNKDTRTMYNRTLTFKVDANDSYDERNGDIVIQTKDCTAIQSISVWQSEKDGLILRAGNEMTVGCNEVGRLALEVAHNIDYECKVELETDADEGWLTILEPDSQTRALEESYIILRLKENRAIYPRSATLTICNTSKGISEQLRLTQQAHTGELKIVHTAAVFALPTLNGGDKATGEVDWGDDFSNIIDGRMVHTYDAEETGEEHVVTIQWSPVVSFKLNNLVGVSAIDLSNL